MMISEMAEGLLYHGNLPLELSPIAVLPGSSQLSLINATNESLLKANLVLHESPEIDEHDEISLELRRQDFKINLLLEMVGELLVQNNSLPPEQEIQLTAQGIQCNYPCIPCIPCIKETQSSLTGKSIATGTLLKIDIYISPTTPKPLILFGELISCNDFNIDLKTYLIHFSSLNQNVEDCLEKVIFRQHRRTIAQSLHGVKTTDQV